MALTGDKTITLLKENQERFDDFVNGATTYTDSAGVVHESLRALSSRLEDEFVELEGAKGFATRAELYDDLAWPPRQMAYVTNDTTPAYNGYYRKEGLSGAGSWVYSGYNVKTEIIRLGQLLRNSGAIYPFKQMTRAGITSTELSTWSDFILDVRVTNARPDEYYQIAYQQNEALLDGENKFDWIILRFDRATFASTGSATTLVSYQAATYGAQQQLVRDGSVQTISLYPRLRPEMRFDITVDTSKLPTAGSIINSFSVNTRPGWSWIIDPACYEYISPLVEDSITINAGKKFPNREMLRGGFTSASNSFLLDCILDVDVKGAREGYYYGIRYFKNGSTALPGPDDGWIIEEQLTSTYATETTAVRVVNYIDQAADITRDGIQTVRLVSGVQPGLEFIITLDTDQLPTYGTFVSMLNEGQAGRSWIIDPACYEYATPSAALTFTSDVDSNITAVWRSGNHLYRLRLGPNGYNSLPNIKGVDTALLEAREGAEWTVINTATTDWLPPLVVQAVSGGDTHAKVYTGGNHGAAGDASGGTTARNILYQLFVDGQPVDMGTEISGDAKTIKVLIANELMAYNTTGTVDAVNFPARYVLRQTFALDIYPGSVGVNAEVRAYEAIVVKTDNGPQMVTTGYQDTMLYVGGQYETRTDFDSATNSGAFSAYPDCWALVLQSDNGQQVSWMDREYEAGDGRYIGSGAPAIRGGGLTNTKFYHAAVASYNLSLAAGEKYKWRGGYAWQASGFEGESFDSIISFSSGGELHQAVVKSASNYTVLP